MDKGKLRDYRVIYWSSPWVRQATDKAVLPGAFFGTIPNGETCILGRGGLEKGTVILPAAQSFDIFLATTLGSSLADFKLAQSVATWGYKD